MTESTKVQTTERAPSNASSREVPSPSARGGRTIDVATRALRYLSLSGLVAAAGLSAIAATNRMYAPEMYRPGYMAGVAETLAAGENYAVFDLNINIRKLREEQLKRLADKPSIIVLGASQWQEAGEDLLPGRGYLNAHVHRDYYEDVLGMVELLVRNDKLPRDLVITLRDRIFTPVESRKDFLWLPGIPYFQAMAKRLSLPQHAVWDTYPLQRPRELLSLPMLFTNATRWHNAADWPYPTAATGHTALDLLKPDGSIRWSDAHQASFTQERARKLALEHAAGARNNPPTIDPRAVEAIDTLLSYLSLRGVKVHLAHPPFNPIYFDAVKNTPYMEGLRRVEAVTRELATKYKTGLVGGFDPSDLGCTAEMFIDAEHSQAPCLARLLADVANSIDLPTATPPQGMAELTRRDMRTHRVMMASGWMPTETPGPAKGAESPTIAAPVAPTLRSSARTRMAAAPAAVVLPSLPVEKAPESPAGETPPTPSKQSVSSPAQGAEAGRRNGADAGDGSCSVDADSGDGCATSRRRDKSCKGPPASPAPGGSPEANRETCRRESGGRENARAQVGRKKCGRLEIGSAPRPARTSHDVGSARPRLAR